MAKIRGLGLIPSPEDKRDILMSSLLPEFSIPRKFQVSKITPVRNQEQEGSCVGFACVVGMKESQEQKEHDRFIELSPRYVYEESKKTDEFHPDGMPCVQNGEFDGTSIKAAMKVLQKKGVCEERYWEYKACHLSDPMPKADENAMLYRIKAYARLDSLEAMKKSLVVNGPFVIGVPVYSNWSSQEVWTTGKIPMPNNSEHRGAHALCVVGYDDDTQLFKFKNSWGKEWGDKGYGYLPYQYTSLKFFEAFSATDLIDNVELIINAKERVLTQMNENYKKDVKYLPEKDKTIKYQ